MGDKNEIAEGINSRYQVRRFINIAPFISCSICGLTAEEAKPVKKTSAIFAEENCQAFDEATR
jgi:hypothetical protein